MTIAQRNNVHDLGGSGPVLLLAHGFGCNQSMWDDLIPILRSNHRIVTFDYVGSGGSDVASFDGQRYSHLEGYAHDVIEVCEAFKLSDITLVGHSVSCSIGILASIQRPELFRRLVFIGPNPCFVNDPPYVGGFERTDLEGLLDLMDQNYFGWAAYLAPVVSAEPTRGSVTGRLSDSFCSTDPVVARIFARAPFFADNRADLPHVSHPCLILQNKKDNLAPLAVGEYLARELPHGVLKVLDISGHCAHMSHPSLVADAILEFEDGFHHGPR
jgi:sigma-B regulation protein RsbQ